MARRGDPWQSAYVSGEELGGRTRVLQGEQVVRYVAPFVSQPDVVELGDISTFYIWNGFTAKEVMRDLGAKFNSQFKLVTPFHGRETLYFDTRRGKSRLHIVQGSGVARQMHYAHMLTAYAGVVGKSEINVVPKYRGGSSATANDWYLAQVNSFVENLFAGGKGVVPTHKIAHVEIGGHVDTFLSVFGDREKKIVNHPYLTTTVVKVGGKYVLHIPDLFSDQAGYVVRTFLPRFEALANSRRDTRKQAAARKRAGPLVLHLNLYGKGGILGKGIELDELMAPNACINLDHLLLDNTERRMIHFDNALRIYAKHKGPVVHTKSVVRETVEDLESAVAAGCIVVDMESLPVVLAVAGAEARESPIAVNLGILIHGSDNPLEEDGETLATKRSAINGERSAVRKIRKAVERANIQKW